MSSADSPSPNSTPPSNPVHWMQIPLKEIKEPTISKIELTTEDLDKLKKILQSKQLCPWSRETRQRKIIGICGGGGIPEYILTKYFDGVKLIERYCAKCLAIEQEKGNFVGNQK